MGKPSNSLTITIQNHVSTRIEIILYTLIGLGISCVLLLGPLLEFNKNQLSNSTIVLFICVAFEILIVTFFVRAIRNLIWELELSKAGVNVCRIGRSQFYDWRDVYEVNLQPVFYHEDGSPDLGSNRTTTLRLRFNDGFLFALKVPIAQVNEITHFSNFRFANSNNMQNELERVLYDLNTGAIVPIFWSHFGALPTDTLDDEQLIQAILAKVADDQFVQR